MVNWAKVQQLRSQGQSWSAIANDPTVDFHPDASAGDPGRALRALYHRSGRKAAQAASQEASPSKRVRKEDLERKWTLTRIGYLLVSTVGLWTLLAYVAPSPVGVLVPAIPYLALVLAGVAFVLIYVLFRRTEGRRWTPVYRTTVIGGVILGLVVAGTIGLAGALLFGCPYLPPASSLSASGGSGWQSGPITAWHANGDPVVFFYGATWCPYCSASSWAIYKALTAFSSVTNAQTDHSSLSDVYPGTPEVVLEYLQLGSKNGHAPAVDFQSVEDTSGAEPSLAPTASCYQQAYVTSYSTGIPFLVVNGQYIHGGSLVPPSNLSTWNYQNGSGGQSTVLSSVNSEAGVPWSSIEWPAWRIMTYIVKALGDTSTTALANLASEYGWTSADKTHVAQLLS